MGDPIVPQPPKPVRMTQAQLDDFAWLLARCLPAGNIRYVAYQVLGPGGVPDAWNQISDLQALAKATVEALSSAGRIADAIALLRQDARGHGRFTLGLNHIISGSRLDSDAALQAFVNEQEPFISSAAMAMTLPKLMQAVCAVALNIPPAGIRGSGFLIGPDLVMTNAHVVAPFLTFDNGVATQNGDGKDIYCFFDYLAEPPPDVPPENTTKLTSIHVRAAEDWLVNARIWLDYDGTDRASPIVTHQLDYAVIRLRKRIGDLPVRRAGGASRGWLPLPAEIEILDKKRVMVFQHPQTAPQVWDLGDYEGPDPSGTRLRYSVSSAHGSSGGAAVDKEGALFALHNAEVQNPPAGKRLNQGVRIDLIAKDLAAHDATLLDSSPTANDGLYWSLNEDILHPRPIIGRSGFRKQVEQMTISNGPGATRAITVTGPAASGLQFSAKLLRRTVGAHVPVAEFSPTDLQTLDPKQFLKHLLGDLQISLLDGDPVPDPRPTETPSLWIRVDLPKWLAGRLQADAGKDPSRYPAWVIVNTALWGPDRSAQRLNWPELKDLIAALLGVHDPGQAAVDIPHLRWLFLSPSIEALPLRSVPFWGDDLSSPDHAAGFAECLNSAWRAVDRKSQGESIALLKGIGRTFIRRYPTGSTDALPRFLADCVAETIREDVLKAMEQ
jgi:hypothetical protein